MKNVIILINITILYYIYSIIYILYKIYNYILKIPNFYETLSMGSIDLHL